MARDGLPPSARLKPAAWDHPRKHRMANILPWLFWCTSAAVGSLASADLLLRDRQKKWINDRATDLWDWLDDQRELKYLPYLHKFRWQKCVVILYAVFALLGPLFVGFLMSLGVVADAS